MKDSIDILLERYKKTKSEEDFAELFTECHRSLLRFLISKGMQIDDGEDLIQDFFIKEFDKSIETYRKERSRVFIFYLQRVIFLRYLSFYDGIKRKKTYLVSPLERLESKESMSSFSTQEQVVKDMLVKEVSDFFRELILGISNKNHRNAFILKLCLPISISAEEAAEVMGCTISTYTTWIYRATLALKKKIKKYKAEGLIKFNFEDVEPLLLQKTFSFDRQIIHSIEDHNARSIISSYFFAKKSIQAIARELGLAEEVTRDYFKKGMFELLALLNKGEILLRGGNSTMLNQDDVIEFIESLDKQGKLVKRNSITTGDKELDRSLRIIHNIFKRESKNIKEPPSIKEIFLNILRENKLSLKEVAKKLNLTSKDIQALMQEDLADIDLRRKIHSFIENFNLNSDDKEQYNESDFDRANKKLLDKYYREKGR